MWIGGCAAVAVVLGLAVHATNGSQTARDPALASVRHLPGTVQVPDGGPRRVGSRHGKDRIEVSPRWVTQTALLTDIPVPALAAYGRATLSAPDSCHLGWTTLAGIGWIESHHGTIDGRTLDAGGRSSTQIVGPTLDGVGDVAAIPATQAGAALHGDTVWEHAVGPMQFLPSTWADWEVDADGDGTADPHDLDDAAVAAADYLCAAGGDLSTASGWSAAVLAYNPSSDYLRAVQSAAQAYADLV